jgi:hypothetical protein
LGAEQQVFCAACVACTILCGEQRMQGFVSLRDDLSLLLQLVVRGNDNAAVVAFPCVLLCVAVVVPCKIPVSSV